MSALGGTAKLTWLALRRDRVRLSAYVVGLALLMAAMLVASAAQPRAAIVDEAEIFAKNPALRIFGVASGVEPGATVMIRGYFLLGILAALMSAFTVVRHTRQNEETGRAELVGAAAVGRHAGLAAALIVSVAANVVLVVAAGLAGLATGHPTASSLTAGAAIGALGIVFAAVAAVTVQLSSTSRGASSLAASVLGAAVVVSGIGNMLGSVDASGVRLVSAWPAWLSPVGWGQQMRAFGGDDWAPLALFAVAFVVLVGSAAMLATRRDVGSGIVAARRGRADASSQLVSPFGLAWRLQRSAWLGWAVAMTGFGLVMGAISDEMRDVGGATAEWYVRMGGSDRILDAYRTSVIAMAGMAAAIYAVQILLRMRAEESDGRIEVVLAASVSRSRWVMSYLLNAAVGATALVFIFATTMGLAGGAVLGDVGAELRTLVVAGLVQLPGIMVIGAVVVAATAFVPRFAGAISWAVVMVSLLLGPLFDAATLQLPEWMQNTSPFTHIPKAPAAEITAVPVIGLLFVATLLAGAGLNAFRHRDLALPV